MSSEGSLSSVFDDLCTNLQFVVDQIKESDIPRSETPDFVLESFWTRIGVIVKAVSQEATKLCLACSEPPLPKPDELKPLVDGIERSTVALLSVYYSLPHSQGLSLRKLIINFVIELVEALKTLVRSLNAIDGTKSKRHLQSTGSVWELCDKFSSLPKDNKQAVLSRGKETLDLISDALEELEESLKSGPDGAGDLDDLANISLNEDDEDIKPSNWSDADRLVISACIGIMKTAKAAMKKLTNAMKLNGSCDSAETVKQFDDFADKISVISPIIDELVLSLYPPVKLDIVSANSKQLVSELRQLIDLARNSHLTGGSDSSWIEFLNKAIDHNALKTSEVIGSMQ